MIRVFRSALLAAFAIFAVAATPALAQEGGGETATLTGLVFDSTRAEPLPNATVAVMGTSITGVSDSTGTFTLEGIPPGEHQLTFLHDRLQELGVSGGTSTVRFEPGSTQRITLSTPSRKTILEGWCALDPGRLGEAHIGGVVRDSLTGVPLPNADVELALPSSAVAQRFRLDQKTDSEGEYRFCNVGGDQDLTLIVQFGNQDPDTVSLRPAAGEGVIQDFELRLSHEVSVNGKVVDQESGEPVEGAFVRLLGTDAQGTTNVEGNFAFSGLPPGRHVLVTEHLGYAERTDTLTVFSREAVGLEVRLATDPVLLDPLVVTGRSRERSGEIMARSVGTRRDVITTEEIDAMIHRVQDVGELLQFSNIPGLWVSRAPISTGGIAIDGGGMCIEVSRARRRSPNSCAQAAVYLNGVKVQSPEIVLKDMDPQSIGRVEVLSPLEAGVMYGTEGSNGVVLLYTR